MADAVTTTVLENGFRFFIAQFTNVSDGTGENQVTKITATSSGSLGVVVAGQTFYPGVHLKIVEIIYDVGSMKVRVQWVATSYVDAAVLASRGRWPLLDSRGGNQGLINPNTTGATGSIAFTTVGASLNATYSILIKCVKGVPQS